MRILGNLSIKSFDRKLDKALERAKELNEEKGDTVVCEYCHQLMPKNEASVVYNLETDKMEYSHEQCFEENNHIAKEGELPQLKEE